MAILDLKTALMVLLVCVAAAVVSTAWLVRYHASRRTVPVSVAQSGDSAGLESALGEAPFGFLTLEGDRIVRANSEAQRLLRFGTPPASLPDADWIPLLLEDCALARTYASARTDSLSSGRYRTVTFASGQTVRWWVAPWGLRELIFVFDVTPQQRAEQVGRTLINDLAHELRTPIATILTHLEVLGLTDVGEDVHQQSLALSKDEAQRMARLINDMLELGRLQTAAEFALRPVELLALVEEVIFQALPQAKARGIALSMESSPPLPLALGNGDRLRQVFLNLLDNALKYAREGDRVVISLARTANGIACAVCDTGPGIPPEHLPHVTRRFYRVASSQVQGSGLGLAIVEEILRRHNTVLEMESRTVGETGTCARFVLPSAEAEEE